jgi:hypothetical protein
MSWKTLLAARKIHTHRSSKQELDELRAVVKRDLADAALPALSEDRRFATAYNAALQVARMATAHNVYLNYSIQELENDLESLRHFEETLTS